MVFDDKTVVPRWQHRLKMRSAHRLNRLQWFKISLYATESTKRALFPRVTFLQIYHSGPFHVGEVSGYHLLAWALQGWLELVTVFLYMHGQRDTDEGLLKVPGNLMLGWGGMTHHSYTYLCLWVMETFMFIWTPGLSLLWSAFHLSAWAVGSVIRICSCKEFQVTVGQQCSDTVGFP